MSDLIRGVEITPTSLQEWFVEGPILAMKIHLTPTGGWDIILTAPSRKEHYPLLHTALRRAYNLASGIEK